MVQNPCASLIRTLGWILRSGINEYPPGLDSTEAPTLVCLPALPTALPRVMVSKSRGGGLVPIPQSELLSVKSKLVLSFQSLEGHFHFWYKWPAWIFLRIFLLSG